MKNTEKRSGNSRTFKMGAASSVLTAFAVVAALLINILFGLLPAGKTRIDVSDAGMFKLSDITAEMLNNLDEDVTIYYLCETGKENTMITHFMDSYAAFPHVKWEQKDPAIYPTFAAAYDADGLPTGSSVVVCGDRSKSVPSTNYYKYEYDYAGGGFTPTELDFENQVTSAIQFVTSSTGEFPKVYQLTGHGETALYGTLIASMNLQNMEYAELALLSVEAVPEDADAVVVNAPTVDYTPDDIAILREYLENGGSLLVTTNAQLNLPNLEALLEEYGLVDVDGLVVEGDSNRQWRGDYPYYLLPKLDSGEAVKSLDKGLNFVMPIAKGIKLLTDVADVETKPLLVSSNFAYNKADVDWKSTSFDISKKQGDEMGPFVLAAQSVKALTDNRQARLVWINSSNMLTKDADTLVGGTNGSFALSCITWLTDAENTLLIGSKNLVTDNLSFSAGMIRVLSLIMVIGIPLLFLIIGAANLIYRKRH